MIDPKLKTYIDNTILPIYDTHDLGHNRTHANNVIARSLHLGNKYKISDNLTYTAAAMHDIAIGQGKENHQLNSATFVKNDDNLKNFFTKREINQIANACEDHGLKPVNPPRGILGKIISDSDNIEDIDKMIIRSHTYGVKHFPKLSYNKQLKRSFDHLNDNLENEDPSYYLKESDNLSNREAISQVLSNFKNYKIEANKIPDLKVLKFNKG